MRREIRLEVGIETGPGDTASHAGEEAMEQRIEMFKIVIQGDRDVAQFELGAVAVLTAAQFAGADARHPVDGIFIQAKINKGLVADAVVQADKLVDDSRPQAKTEHEGDGFAGIATAQKNEVADVRVGHHAEKLRRHPLELGFSLLIGLPIKPEDLVYQSGVGMLDDLGAKFDLLPAAAEL